MAQRQKNTSGDDPYRRLVECATQAMSLRDLLRGVSVTV